MKRTALLAIAFALYPAAAAAADLSALKAIFHDKFNEFYVARQCGSNIGRLIDQATEARIDLSHSYVLKVEGAGFLETSGFYTRGLANERAMLGYFHFVFVADGHVFDFDLNEPLVLEVEDYARLQFTPPYLPYRVLGMAYEPVEELRWWTVSRLETASYNTQPTVISQQKMGEWIDLPAMMARRRLR